ncbi:MAG: T9SS type A sorting domain-containing protein [Bacteroidia bacterium]|nr:T9SS type A sorting domain-containing protein [Bacteroidia bacterium]
MTAYAVPPVSGPLLDRSLIFEENRGQFDPSVRFRTHTANEQIRFLQDGISVAMVREIPHPAGSSPKDRPYVWMDERDPDYEALVWQIRFDGAAPDAAPAGEYLSPGYYNYLIGADPAGWATHVQRFNQIRYAGLYAGIDLVYYGTEDQALKYDFIVQPGSDPGAVRMVLDGVLGLSADPASGRLTIYTSWGSVQEEAPVAYQEIGGVRQIVPCRYRQIDELSFGFELPAGYRRDLPLVIDPLTLSWGTFLHSSLSDDYAHAVVRDAQDRVYMAGYTKAVDFPVTPGVFQNLYHGGIDNFIAKLSPGGGMLEFATFLGGNDWELAYGIGLDAADQIYVTGYCRSLDYPVTAGAFCTIPAGGGVEGFLSKLSADGDSLLFSTLFGGSGRDYLYDLHVQPDGTATVCGYTFSANLPLTSDAAQGTYGGGGDACVAQFSPDGGSLLYSSYFGGYMYDIAQSVDLDTAGVFYIGGTTGSPNLPVTPDALQGSMMTDPLLAAEDGFVAVLAPGQVRYASYLGGSDSDGINGIDLSADGELFVAGTTYSHDFPTSTGAWQASGSPGLGAGDAFAARMSLSPPVLIYATCLGGSDAEFTKAIRVNDDHEAFILGATRSANFPVSLNSRPYAAQYDVFLTVLTAEGSQLKGSSLYGGAYNDYPKAAGGLYLSGHVASLAVTTHSPDAPVTAGAYQTVKTNGLADAPWLLSTQLDLVLPASLAHWEAAWQAAHAAAELNWQLQGPAPDLTVSVERSLPGEGWEVLRTGAGIGETWLDAGAAAYPGQMLRYRLGMHQADGALTYSTVQEVRIPAASQAPLAWPNPAKGRITVQAPERGMLVLCDLRGQALAVQAADAGRTEWQLPPLPAGLYVLRFSGAGAVRAQRLQIE